MVLQSRGVRANCSVPLFIKLQVFCYHCQGEAYVLLQEILLRICACNATITGPAWLLYITFEKDTCNCYATELCTKSKFSTEKPRVENEDLTSGRHTQLELNACFFSGNVLLEHIEQNNKTDAGLPLQSQGQLDCYISRLRKTHEIAMQQRYVRSQSFQLEKTRVENEDLALGSHTQPVLNASYLPGNVLSIYNKTIRPMRSSKLWYHQIVAPHNNSCSPWLLFEVHHVEDLLLLIAEGHYIWVQWLLLDRSTDEGEVKDLHCLLS